MVHSVGQSCGTLLWDTLVGHSEVEVVDDVEMERPKDPAKEEQDIIDKLKTDEVKTALQSQIENDDEDEEVS